MPIRARGAWALVSVIAACDGGGWADGSWMLERAPSVGIAADARLEIDGNLARLRFDDLAAVQFAVAENAANELRLTPTDAKGDALVLRCDAFAGSVCSSLRGIAPGDAYRFVRATEGSTR